MFERCRSWCRLCLNSTVNLADFFKCDSLPPPFPPPPPLFHVCRPVVCETPYLSALSAGTFPGSHSSLAQIQTHRSSQCMSNETIRRMPQPRRCRRRSSQPYRGDGVCCGGWHATSPPSCRFGTMAECCLCTLLDGLF